MRSTGDDGGGTSSSSERCSKLRLVTSGSAWWCTSSQSPSSRRNTQVTRSDQSWLGMPPTTACWCSTTTTTAKSPDAYDCARPRPARHPDVTKRCIAATLSLEPSNPCAAGPHTAPSRCRPPRGGPAPGRSSRLPRRGPTQPVRRARPARPRRAPSPPSAQAVRPRTINALTLLECAGDAGAPPLTLAPGRITRAPVTEVARSSLLLPRFRAMDRVGGGWDGWCKAPAPQWADLVV